MPPPLKGSRYAFPDAPLSVRAVVSGLKLSVIAAEILRSELTEESRVPRWLNDETDTLLPRAS